MPATLASDLVAETRRHFMSTHRDEKNKLSGALGVNATSIVFNYDLGGIKPGARVTIDLEDYHIWETNEGTKTAIVEPAQYGSASTTHATGTMATVNGIITDREILDAINAELSDMVSPGNGLFRVGKINLTAKVGTQGYDLTGVTTDFIDVIEIRWKTTGSSKYWPLLKRGQDWMLSRDMDTGEFASGNVVLLFNVPPDGQTMRVRYRQRYGTFAALTTTLASVGLQDFAADIPPLGAAMRLASGREVARNFFEVQGDTRRAAEVPPGAQIGAIRNLAALKAQRIASASADLAGRFPSI